MKSLSNLIKGLQIIQSVEDECEFNSQEAKFFIGKTELYSKSQISELESLGFDVDTEFDCFCYDLD